MAGTRPKPGDLTGIKRAQATKDLAEEQSRRADEITMITAQKTEHLSNAVFDGQNNEVEEVAVSLTDPFEIVRVIEDLNFAYGPENYDLKVGQKYRLPKHIAEHLEEKGYLWRN